MTDDGVFDGKLDSVTSYSYELSPDELRAKRVLERGSLPSDCPYCAEADVWWNVTATYVDGDIDYFSATCSECGIDMAKRLPVATRTYIGNK